MICSIFVSDKPEMKQSLLNMRLLVLYYLFYYVFDSP